MGVTGVMDAHTEACLQIAQHQSFRQYQEVYSSTNISNKITESQLFQQQINLISNQKDQPEKQLINTPNDLIQS